MPAVPVTGPTAMQNFPVMFEPSKLLLHLPGRDGQTEWPDKYRDDRPSTEHQPQY